MTEVYDSSLVIRNIAIATDFSPWSDRAMRHALFVAHKFGAVLHFIHTVRRSEFAFVPDLMVQLDELAERDGENLMSVLHAAHCLDGIQHHYWNLHGECSEVFGRFLSDQKIDLLVLGTRGRTGISKLLLGSIAEEISKCVSTPVLAVGPASRDATCQLEVRNVLFAADLSMGSSAALPYVLTAARTWGAKIDILCLSENSTCQHFTEGFNRKIDILAASKQDLSVQYHIQPGAASTTVLHFAQRNKADLIILGLDHRGSRFGGFSLYEIVRQSTCPVLGICSEVR